MTGSGVAVLLAAVMSGPGAAPTSQLEDRDVVAPVRNPEAGITRSLTPAMPGLGPSHRTDIATSTGNKNLDLLLEFQSRPGEELRQVPARSAAAAAVASAAAAPAPAAAALAGLRANAAERPATELPAADPAAARSVAPFFKGLDAMDGDGRTTPRFPERREWTGQPAGAGSSFRPDQSDRSGDRGSDALREGYSDDNLLRGLLRKVVAFLRDSRYWLLGALGGVAVLGFAIKFYSRRI